MNFSFYSCDSNSVPQSPATLHNYQGTCPQHEPGSCLMYQPTTPEEFFYKSYNKDFPIGDQPIEYSNNFLQPPGTLYQDYSYEEPHTLPGYEFDNHHPQMPYNPNDLQFENWGNIGLMAIQPSRISDDIPKKTTPKPRDNTPLYRRRNLKKLLDKDYSFDKTQYLMLYTFEQLKDSSCDDIVWIDKQNGIFCIQKPEEFAKKWGRYKKKPEMSYQKVSRSFRYYYSSKLLMKSEGLRHYRWDKKALETLERNFKNGTPLLAKTIHTKE